LSNLYLMSWIAVAGLSVAYTGLAALYAPERPSQSPTAAATTPNGEPVRMAARSEAVEAAEQRAMTYKVALEDFQRDIALIRGDLQTAAGDASTVARLAALEERLSIETGLPSTRMVAATVPPPQASSAPPAAAPVSGSSSKLAAAKPGPAHPSVATSSATRVAGALVKVDGAGDVSMSIPLETGSIAKPADRVGPASPSVVTPAIINAAPTATSGTASSAVGAVAKAAAPTGFAAVTVTPAAPAVAATPASPPRPFAVQLGSANTADSLRLTWSFIADQNRESLAGLEPRFTTTTTPTAGPIYDLMAGPFKTAADARKTCKALAQRGVDCRVANFAGDAL
jgi:hypothetical protein